MKANKVIIMFFLMLLVGVMLMHYVCVVWTLNNIAGLKINWWAQTLLPFLLSVAFVGLMSLSRGAASFLAPVVYIWLGSLFLWFALVFVVMFVQITLAALRVSPPFAPGLYALALAFVISLLSVLNAARVPAVRQISLSSPKARGGLKVAQLSDTHLGDSVSPAKLQKLVDKIN
ncbi:MAG: hypothetical protein LBR90_03160, partial [Elusimicrobiota bacterium]|nr:hypothetical protein [Elusimicrobiota bacterium]